MNNYHSVQNALRVDDFYFGEGSWCKTHKAFWGDKYPHCYKIKDGQLCVPAIREEGDTKKYEVFGGKLSGKEVKKND